MPIGVSGNIANNINNGFRYSTKQGTTTVDGEAIVELGNNTASGTEGNKKGFIRLYGKNSGRVQISYSADNTLNASAIIAEAGTFQMKPTQLYNNTSGTKGTVTLSQTADDFAYIEIHYSFYSDKHKTARVYSPNSKTILLDGMDYNTNANSSNFTKVYTISAKSITKVSSACITRNFSNGSMSGDTNDNIYIYRVDGYK